MRCPNCGHDNPAGVLRCERCGEALRSPALGEERKVITILFADVVASTHLSTQLDAEHLREQMARFFAIAREEIDRYGGTVEKFIGDAVMAAFGLPSIHEDDAARAVQAALAIRNRTRPFVQAGVLPEIRIGINTGEVVASLTAARQGEFMVTGEAVNLAARLQQSAKPGQVRVGEATYDATQWAFEYRKVSPLQVKGRTGKVAGYECVGPRARPLATHGAGITSPLVGREAESAALLERVTQLAAGRGGITAVIGDAGLGKSRLITEVRRATTTIPLLWLEGRALSFSQTISYWPFLNIIREATAITEHDSEADSWTKLEQRVRTLLPDQVPEIVPYLGTLLGLSAPERWQERVRYLNGEAMGRQIYRSSRLFFERLAEARPLVLVFEDLQWADQSSAALLDHLFPLVTEVPLLLVGLGRPDPQTPAAHLREVARREYADRYTEIVLTPLVAGESAQLVRNLLQIDEVPPTMRDVILGRAEGNPFFVEEIIRTLIELNVIIRDDAGQWQLATAVDQIAVPGTLRGVIMARVDRLDEKLKSVLKTAAVIGRAFHHKILQALVDAPERLDDQLMALQQQDLLQERQRVPEREYVFKHAVTQEAIYESILLRQRRDLHRRVGDIVKALFAARPEEVYGLLAYHYARAEDWPKALDYLLKAGDQAGKLASDAEALHHYQEALAAYARVFGDQWDPLQRAGLERKMGEAFFRRGDHRQATEYLQRALRLLGRPFPIHKSGVGVAIVSQAVRQVGHRLGLGRSPHLELRVPASDLRLEEETRIYEAMAWIDWYADPKRLLLEALKGLNVTERHGYAYGICRASVAVGLICDLIPLFRVAGSYLRRAVALAEDLRHPLAIGLAYVGLGLHVRHAEGNNAAALKHFQRSAGAYLDAGELRLFGGVTTHIAWVRRQQGQISPSLEHSHEVMRVGQEIQHPQVLGWGLVERGRTLLHLGKLEEAAGDLQEAMTLFKEIPDWRWIVISNGALAQCLLRLNRTADAFAVLDEGARIITEHGLRGWHRTAHRLALAEALLRTAQKEDRERAAWRRRISRACRAALQQARVDREAAPSAYRLQGTWAWLSGDRSAAELWWQRSLRAAGDLGALSEVGLTCLEMGRQMHSRQYLEQAEKIFAQTGARGDLAEARGWLQRAG